MMMHIASINILHAIKNNPMINFVDSSFCSFSSFVDLFAGLTLSPNCRKMTIDVTFKCMLGYEETFKIWKGEIKHKKENIPSGVL